MTKQKILDVAFELFSKGHYNSVSILEISKKAGIKKPSIYAHFDSKESLFLEVFEEEASKIYKKLYNIIDEYKVDNAKNILSGLLIESINYIRDNKPAGGFWAYVFFVTPYDLPEGVIKSIDRFKIVMRDLIYETIQNSIRKEDFLKEELDSIIYSYCCLLQGNLLMELNSDVFDMNNVYKSLDYFWNGVEHNLI